MMTEMSTEPSQPHSPRVVLDVDGVLADLSAWTPILTDPDIPETSRWKTFFSHIHEAPLIDAGARLVAALVELDQPIYYSTTRPGWLTTPTRQWLVNKGLPSKFVYVRERRDRRDPIEIKLEHCLQVEERIGHPILAFVDDEPTVVTALRAAGITAFTLTDLTNLTKDDLRQRLAIPIPGQSAGGVKGS